MNELDIYTNKKFDILKIIKMVLKRKGWGEKYTLYSTPTHEVFTSMTSYNFEDRYATFKLSINEKTGNGYYSTTFNIYTDREDYTIKFINNLLLKKIISSLGSYRNKIFEDEAYKLYPYVWRGDKTDEEWIEEFDSKDKITEIQNLNIDDDEKEEIIDNLIERKLSSYENKVTYRPREKYVKNAMESNREKPILDLIEEIKKELEEK